MTRIKKSDFVLVFDRYFSRKPNAAVSVLSKTLYCCAECVCMLLCLLEIYNVPASRWIVSLFCVGFTALLCVIFSFVKKRIAIPAFVLVCCLIIRSNREALWEKLTYLIDALLRAMDGPVFSMLRYLWHPDELSVSRTTFAVVCVSCVIAMICAGSMFKKPTGIAPLITFVVLFAPMGIAQKLSFNLWLVPTAALLIGGIAVAKSFSDGIITRGGVYAGCRAALKSEERSFKAQTAKIPVIQRVGINAVHYSKYFSAAVCAVAIFTAAGFSGAMLMKDRSGIDYSGIYEFFENLGKNSPMPPSPDDDFISPHFSNGLEHTLGIASPGTSERVLLRAKNSGEEVYMRGDIGVDFTVNTWTSHTAKAPITSAAADKITKIYRPAEMLVLGGMEQDLYSIFGDEYGFLLNMVPEKYVEDGRVSVFSKSDISLEYVTRTSVAFLPAYTSDFFYYDDNNFNVYGDYVARYKQNKIDTIKCTALSPLVNYKGYDAKNKERLIAAADYINRTELGFSQFFDVIIPAAGNGRYSEYLGYIKENYLGVPENIRGELSAFLNETGLYFPAERANNIIKYNICVGITDYLKSNYTYSLDADNGALNPVMSFLTETKSGHCALYASAMTLMVRSMGIPARYCTGFVVPHTMDGETAVIKSKNLHAWCEVYFENIGWITFDPTGSALNAVAGVEEDQTSSSPSSESSIPPESSEESESSAESESSEESGSSESEISEDSFDNDSEESGGVDPNESGDSAYPGEEKGKVNILPFVIASALAILAAALVITAVYRFRRLDKEAKRALEMSKTYGSCEELYAKIIAILNLCGFRQNTGEQPDRFFARADSHFKTKLSKNTKMLMKIAFAKDNFSAEELYETALLLESIFNAADSQLVLTGRVKLRKIITVGPPK